MFGKKNIISELLYKKDQIKFALNVEGYSLNYYDIRRYQKEHGLPVTGIIDLVTANVLLNHLSSVPTPNENDCLINTSIYHYDGTVNIIGSNNHVQFDGRSYKEGDLFYNYDDATINIVRSDGITSYKV